jgi:hypothetical protein
MNQRVRFGHCSVEIMNHKRRRSKRQRAGGARHGRCKPAKVAGNSTAKGDRFGRFKARDVRQLLREGDV